MISKFDICLVILTLCIVSAANGKKSTEPEVDESVIVQTKSGPVEGRRIQKKNIDADVYRGIPYARAPIRQLRFERPQPPEKWTQPLDCRDWHSRCIQFDQEHSETTRLVPPPGLVDDSEDCLTVNVYAKHGDENVPKPVFFWIHGGGFIGGSAVEWGVDGVLKQFVQHDVVVVTVQYRLGALGLLSVPDHPELDNIALWDLNAALDWVHENIAKFGGDVSKITVGGHSAGSMYASLLDISPITTDKFHHLALMSGSPVADLFVPDKPAKSSKQLSVFLGCDLPSNQQMIDCMKSKEASEVRHAFVEVIQKNSQTVFQQLFQPTFGNEILPESPEKVLGKARKSNKPVLMGTTTGEMAFMHYDFITKTYAEFNEMLDIQFIEPWTKNAELVKRLVKYEYVDRLGQNLDGHTLYGQTLKLMSDIYFTAPAAGEATLRSESESKVWVYNFAFWQEHAFNKGISPNNMAAFHGIDVAYLFMNPIWMPTLMPDFQLNKAEIKLAKEWAQRVTHFIKQGTPVANAEDWPNFTTIGENPGTYLEVNASSTVKHQYQGEIDAFWNHLITDIKHFRPSKLTKTQSTNENPDENYDDLDDWAWRYRVEDEL